MYGHIDGHIARGLCGQAHGKGIRAAFVHTHRGGRHDQALRIVIRFRRVDIHRSQATRSYGENSGPFTVSASSAADSVTV